MVGFCDDQITTGPTREWDSQTQWQLNEKSAKSVVDHTPLLALQREAEGDESGLSTRAEKRNGKHVWGTSLEIERGHQQGEMVAQLSVRSGCWRRQTNQLKTIKWVSKSKGGHVGQFLRTLVVQGLKSTMKRAAASLR